MTPPHSRLRLGALVFALIVGCAGFAARVGLTHGPAAKVDKAAEARAEAEAPAPSGFKNFESPQVHPLALTPDGTRLLAVNSPNATLSVFQITTGQPTLLAEIPVGLEPVSVAARNDREAWVVNWLSDSVSVVDLASGNVTRTIEVGDEPTDVVFAGLNREMAFVCVSGVSPFDATGRGSVKVFDLSSPTAASQVIMVEGKQPRALARNATGSEVYVSVFESGNKTTVVDERAVSPGGGLPPPSPSLAPGLPAPPVTGLILRHNGSAWVDEINRNWNARVPYTLSDVDLVVLSAAGDSASAAAQVRGVGTHVGNAAFNPTNNQLVVANLESENFTRFEPNLSGRFQSNRVTFVSLSGTPAVSSTVDLNPHVDFTNPAGSDAERAQSLALPADIARSSDGTIYVAATSSARVGVLAPTGAVQTRVAVGQGPTGLALDESRSRLYVLNRFDQTLSVVDTDTKSQTAQVSVGFNPEPADVREGRHTLYDASLSAHGTVSCASCHQQGHRDGLAWDLGNPRGQVDTVPVALGPGFNFGTAAMHPMKGPMATQSLRGILGTEPLHWRGDRTGLAQFNGAFPSLLGGPRQLSPDEMATFTAFVRTLTYPPNPLEPLDRTLTPQAATGRNHFVAARLDANVFTCNDCHAATNFGTGTNGLIIPGIALGESQGMKVPQLRGLYQKQGLSRSAGEKTTGFGFIHDGSTDNLVNFLRNAVFTFPAGLTGEQMRRDIEQFLLTLDTGTAPAVGLQTTANAENKSAPEVAFRAQLLMQRATAGDCDLVVRGLYGGAPRGFLYAGAGLFQPDSASEAKVTLQQLLDAVAPGAELTFTGVPKGRGAQMALDRDGDGILNDDEPRTSVQLTGRVVDPAGNGVAGVTVTLGGAQRAVAVTDASGRFTFGNVSTAGTHTLTPSGGNLTFAPASRTVANPQWNQTAYFVTPASAQSNVIGAGQFFVRQHYTDFLNREPDQPGLDFWTNQTTNCGNADLEVCRINVSGAFFLSIEFQETGYLLYLLTKATFPDSAQHPQGMPRYAEFFPDQQRLGRYVVVGPGDWKTQLEANKQAFFAGWVARPEFRALYDAKTNQQYVDALAANAGIADGQIDKATLVAGLNSGAETRASVIRKVCETAAYVAQEKNRAFVLMQYLGYLRRNPSDPPEPTLDFQGYNFWLGKLNDHGGNYVEAEMVKAFITSGEYLARFGQ